MVASENLYELIKSLSASEKGYFRKQASLLVRGDENNYMKLFQAMELQPTYDEKELLRKFAKEKFTNNFSVAKNYLYDLILKSLESYHSDVDAELKSLVRRIEILYQRGLHGHCEKLLVKAKNLAKRYDDPIQLAELLAIETEIWRRQTFADKTEEDVDALFDELDKTVEVFSNLVKYRRHFSKLLYLMVKSGTIRNITQEVAYKHVMKEPLLRSEKKALSLKARLVYYNCRVFYFSAASDYTQMLEASREIVRLMEETPQHIEINPSFYWSSVGNIVVCLDALKRYQEMPAALDKMIHYKPTTPGLKSHQYFLHRNLLISMYTKTGRNAEGVKVLEQVDRDLTSGDVMVPNRYIYVWFLYNAAYLYFSAGEYQKSNALVQQILDNYADDTGSDYQCFARILRLLIQFESGKNELLEYTVKSTYRFLFKRNMMYKMESSLLKFLKRVAPQISSEKQQRVAFNDLRDEIASYSTEKYQAKALDYFDMISWLESKIKRKPFAEVLRKKSKFQEK
jgi:tetratricopeptide (TPR) repeat protein